MKYSDLRKFLDLKGDVSSKFGVRGKVADSFRDRPKLKCVVVRYTIPGKNDLRFGDSVFCRSLGRQRFCGQRLLESEEKEKRCVDRCRSRLAAVMFTQPPVYYWGLLILIEICHQSTANKWCSGLLILG